MSALRIKVNKGNNIPGFAKLICSYLASAEQPESEIIVASVSCMVSGYLILSLEDQAKHQKKIRR
jgi:hypothetical protein